ncbi:DUF1906 domain-containing protein [Corynebacterium sp. LK2510]|uniref:DUF1906 domain-containing protein n=1 Tax=Corynebacterium sp. LK2510 TaxID=3110472 RepID=UPI0034CF93B5
MTSINRRRFLQAAGLTAVAGLAVAPRAAAQNRILGTVLDYSAGVPSGRSVKAAGHLGAVRYVSQRRPGADWMVGKPVQRAETEDFKANGLATASVYQFGRAETADWLGGAGAAATHAPQAIALHRAAGGPVGRPIYIAIDDNPTRAQYDNQIRPYLRAFSAALTAAGYQTGVYGNYNVIQWCVEDGIGTYFWMHDWGSGGRIHPRAQIHQPARRTTRIDGVECDVNNIYAADWGQWAPGQAPVVAIPAPAPAAPVPVSPEMIQEATMLSSQASSQLPVDQAINAARAFLGR